ncbi:MAG: recombinase family protein, partial [Candidatus Bipolaricaulota bacterium]
TDTESGAKRDRPGLQEALAALQAGDTLTVWRLDRLGRSLPHLIEILADLGARGIHFRSLTENIDTTTPTGRLVFHIIGALAEFERALIVERTRVGLTAAKIRGVKLGRRPALRPEQLHHARTLIQNGASPREVARTLQVGRSTLYRALAE